MTAYTTRMPSGFPGRVTREDSLTIVPAMIDTGTPPTVYGAPVKLVSGLLQPWASGDSAGAGFGILVSAYPTQSSTNTLGAATPPTSGVIDVLRRGFISVKLAKGTSVKGGQVYVVTTAGGTVVVGDYVTSTSPSGGGTAVAMTGAFFEGPADADGNVEISYNI